MKLWTIFLRPEVLSFRCERCDETTWLVEREFDAFATPVPAAHPSPPGMGRP